MTVLSVRVYVKTTAVSVAVTTTHVELLQGYIREPITDMATSRSRSSLKGPVTSMLQSWQEVGIT